jgi:trehalose utilization protein
MSDQIRVTVWNENLHGRKNPIVAQVNPEGMHRCIADGLREDAAFPERNLSAKLAMENR